MTHQIHGTCVTLSGVGVLLRGPSGRGKSDLALRLIDQGAALVADDRVNLEVTHGVLTAQAPAALAGMIEVRGMGIVRMAAIAQTTIGLVIDLVEEETVERMPEPMVCHLLEIELPLIHLVAQAASATARVRLAVGAVQQPASLVAVS